MTFSEDEVICIRHWDYSETSQTVGLFTRTTGLVKAIAKGSKRERGGFSGGVDLLSRANATIVMKPGSDLATLVNWSMIENYPNIRRELKANKIAYFAADLMGRMFEALDPHPNMYGAFAHFLRQIGSGENHTEGRNELSLLEFQWNLLKEAGVQPSLGRGVEGAQVVHFDPRDGGRVVASESATTWKVRSSTMDVLDLIKDTGVELPETIEAASVVRANRLLATYIREVIGEEPFTMRMLFGPLQTHIERPS